MKKLNKGQSTTTWIIVGIVVVVGIILFGALNNESDLDTSIDDDIAVTTPGEAMDSDFDLDLVDPEEELLTDINENPDAYYGQSVQVRGEVEDVITADAFVLDVPGLFNDEVLVVTEDPFNIAEMEEQDWSIDGDAYVEGTVEQFSVVSFADTDLDLEAEVISVYEGEPFIRASSVVLEQE